MESADIGKIYLVDKPHGWTSFDVVKKIRNCLKAKRVGHSGTLDPLASGLLVLCTGKKTKEIPQIQEMEKEYVGEFTLGQITQSYDLETPVEIVSDCSHVSDKDILSATNKFVGEIEQTPPAFSAVKVDGRRAYVGARKGEVQKIRSRKVYIHDFEIIRIDVPIVEFKVICSKGTYIRSLASDFGKEVGTGAHLSKLIRTRIGEFRLEDARTIDKICSDEGL